MKRTKAILIAASLSIAFAYAFAPPVDDLGVIKTFGSSCWGDYSIGLTFSASSVNVKAIGDGEIFFISRAENDPEGLPSTLGAYTAVVHKGDIVSLYPYLQNYGRRVSPVLLKEGESVGISGGEGLAATNGTSIVLFDIRKRRFVNPVSLFPELPDAIPPSARAIKFVSAAGAWALGEGKRIPQGTYDLVAEIGDSALEGSGFSSAPFSIEFTIDGVRKGQFVFDAAESLDGRRSMFDPSRGASEFWAEDGHCTLGTFLLARGSHELWLSIKDFAGNEKTLTLGFVVE
jgi:hypothetical protein